MTGVIASLLEICSLETSDREGQSYDGQTWLKSRATGEAWQHGNMADIPDKLCV